MGLGGNYHEKSWFDHRNVDIMGISWDIIWMWQVQWIGFAGKNYRKPWILLPNIGVSCRCFIELILRSQKNNPCLRIPILFRAIWQSLARNDLQHRGSKSCTARKGRPARCNAARAVEKLLSSLVYPVCFWGWVKIDPGNHKTWWFAVRLSHFRVPKLAFIPIKEEAYWTEWKWGYNEPSARMLH